jgi:hypothetical protein
MDIHHDSSFKSILVDDSISSSFKAHIFSYLKKGARLWLIVKPSICLFHITHFIFTFTLRFYFNLIQPSTFSLFTCDCGYGLDTFGTHLAHCLFRNQPIATHDTIRNVMYALTQENGHDVWKKWRYAITSRVSL